MARFHALTVTDVTKTIRDAVVITVMPREPDKFNFIQGQYLTFRRTFDGQELRRSYSICAGLDDRVLQVGIKKVDGGTFSSWVNESLKVGDILEAMQPMGSFHTALEPEQKKNYLGFAAGSGITPILSIMRTVLHREPASRFTLVYANKAVNTIMFRDEIEDLKNTFMDRLSIVHVLGQDAQGIDLFTGRLDREKCDLLFKNWINVQDVDVAFICGPEPMMLTVAGSLKDRGMRDEQIKFELFASSQPGRAKRKTTSASATHTSTESTAKVILDGETRSFVVPKDLSLLGAALQNDIDAPFACRAGVCSTCRAKVLEGDVEMAANHALEDYEVEQGYVLTCQCFLISDAVVIDYDQ
ncbi:MAG: 2Fe-2S iron-sulfur cluster-binding protein [Paracoccaceae bacterium]